MFQISAANQTKISQKISYFFFETLVVSDKTNAQTVKRRKRERGTQKSQIVRIATQPERATIS
jgi:phosphopantetheine adenylyltransferase